MAVDIPELYYRIKDNGAVVFRVDPENRQKRINLDQIATINTRNGDIKAHPRSEISDAETAEMTRWLRARQALIQQRELEEMSRTVDQLNLTAHWAQSKATPEELDEITDRLLLAMYDLRQVLVRKKADRANGR